MGASEGIFKTKDELQKAIKSKYAGDNLPLHIGELQVTIPKANITVVSDICHVLDVPGLEDQEYYHKL